MTKKMDFDCQDDKMKAQLENEQLEKKDLSGAVDALLIRLKEANIRLSLSAESKLKIRAPKGALTDALKQQLKAHKDAIVELLKQKSTQASSTESSVSNAKNSTLSFTQERLWFLDQLEGASNLYNMPGLFKLTGTIHIEKLQSAFAQIIHRHAVLRTHFLTQKGQGYAQVNPQSEWQLERHDLSKLNDKEIEQQTQQIIKQQLASSFDLTKDCLLRTLLIKQSTANSVLMLNMHHIISDGWSVQVLIREFISLYSAAVSDEANSKYVALAPLNLQYSDYALWQRKHLQEAKLEQSLEYWRQQLNAVEVLELPTDFPRPDIQTNRGALHHFDLDAKLIEQLKTTAQQQGVTLFMMLLAALSLLLSRYSQQDDVCIGSPIANRNREELQDLIGFFANTLVFRQKLDPQTTISKFLQVIKKNTIDAYEHQETPFEKVVDGLKIERSLRHSPLFQVMLVLQNIAQERIQLPELEIESLAFDSGNAKFDLTFTIEEAQSQNSNEPIAVSIEYNTDLFKAKTIAKMAMHFVNVLQVFALATKDSKQLLGDIEFLSEQERHLQLVDWQRDAVQHDEFLSVQQMFETQVLCTPDAKALIYGEQTLSYQQLNAQANQLAHWLNEQGIGRGQSVGICLSRSLEMIVSLYGVIKSGASYIPMDINYPRERLLYMLSESNAPLLITESSLQQSLNLADDKVFLVDTQWPVLNQYSKENRIILDQRDDPLYTIFTSGSTGQPKGAQVRHRGELNLLPWYTDDFAMTAQDNILLMSAFGFDLTQKNLFAPLVCGAVLVIPTIDHYDPDYLRQAIKQHNITWLNCAPSAFYPLIEKQANWSDVTTLRYVFLGGEPISLQKITPWEHQSHCQLVNSYGPTECTDIASYHVLESTDDFNRLDSSMTATAIPIGKANHNVQLYILNKQRQLIPEGHIGELYIGGQGVGLGYINQPELTQAKFTKKIFSTENELLYQTGDLVRYQANGVIEYIGRTDFQVKLRGLRIELGEIEYHLGQLEDIYDSAVRIVKDNHGIEQLVAYIVRTGSNLDKNSDTTYDKEAYRKILINHLPEYMVPAHYIEMDNLPLTPNGKVDNKALPALEVKSLADNYQAPESSEEKILCEIWTEFLSAPGLNTDNQLQKLGIHDNFFELGGDSILSIQIISRANDAGLVLQPRDIFEYQTIARLAQHAQKHSQQQIKQLFTEQGVLSGDILLAPVQTRFFAQNYKNQDHWNQSILLKVSKQLNREMLNTAFNHLVTQHDVLHSHFTQDNQGRWSQSYIDWQTKDALIKEEKVASKEQLDNRANDYQASLSIEQGRLIQGVLFTEASSHDDNRLLIVIHHLVIDGISWRVLFSDLQKICNELLAQKGNINLAAKKSSYRQWTAMLSEYAQSDALLAELPYWQTQANKHILPLPVDQESDTILMSDGVFLHLEMSEAQTQQLLLNVNNAYHTEINDILLATLLMAVNQWCGNEQITIALEGHGRESLSDTIDISNTVGWFTSVFPVCLSMDSYGSVDKIQSTLKSVKEQLRAIPNKGVAYSILRYMHADKTIADSLTIEPQISFNYLGQVDNVLADSELFAIADEASGQNISPDNHHPYLLDLNCIVVNGKLQLDWTFSGRHFSTKTVEKLANIYNEVLSELIEHCLQAENTGYTPSDFPLTQSNEKTRLTQLALDSLCEKNTQIEDIYPLSPMQKGMLFHTAYDVAEDSSDAMYIEQLQLNFNGELNPQLFQQAWQTVLSKHTSLRSSFVYQQGLEPLQLVHKIEAIDCQIESIDFRGWDELHLQDFLLADRKRGFDLAVAPLMRWHLLTLEDKQLFVWTFHHLILDGWSTALILQEVLQCYQRLTSDKKASGERMGDEKNHQGIQDEYKEFIHYLQSQDKSSEKHYWQTYLNASCVSELPLMSGHFDGSNRSNQGDASNMGEVIKHKLIFTPLQTDNLNTFAKQNHVTINTLLQGLWALLLAKYSHSDSAQFGVVVSGRPSSLQNIDNKVGLFINSLPMHITINSEQPINEWFQTLQQEQVAHQAFHHSAINDIQHWVNEADKQADLFNHLFVFENYPVDEALQGDDLPFEVLDLEMVEKTNYPLTVSVTLATTLAIEFAYDSHVYTLPAIEQLCSQLDLLLDSVLSQPELPIRDIKWLTDKAEQHLLLDLNQTQQAYNHQDCLHTSFELQATRWPDNIALSDANSEMTYQQVNEKANQLAYYLIEQGVKTQTIIGICMPRNNDMIVSLLAVLKVGCAYVPMDPNYPEERLAFIIEDSNTPILLTQSTVLDNLSSLTQAMASQIIAIDEADLLSDYPTDNLGTEYDIAHSSESLAYVIYTSGSTGKPKGVMVRHRNVQNLCQWHQSSFVVNETSRATQIANIAFDAAAWEIWPYLLAGASLYLVDQNTILGGDSLLNFYAEHQISHSFVPTPVAESLLQLNWSETIALDYLLTGGDRLSAFVAENYNFEFVNNYGPTETTVVATSTSLSNTLASKNTLPPIGRPVNNTQLYIVDQALNPVPMGVVGELLIGGAGVAKGYLNLPELTAEKFIANPFSFQYETSQYETLYRTGDLVRYRLDGQIEFVGRTDDQVKIRGYRIELGEISSCINLINGVKEAIVVVNHSQQNIQRLVAFWVAKDSDSHSLSEADIRKTLQSDLPDYMIPAKFVKISALPLTPHGKIDSKALPEVSFDQAIKFQAAETEAQQILLKIWQDVLNKENIGIHDNFFELGGDSILSIQIISRASDAGFTLQPRDVFDYQSIAELAQYAQSQSREIITEQGVLEGEFDLSPIQHWFFEQAFYYANHWNQSVMLNVSKQFDSALLKQAFSALLAHHDALQIKFSTQAQQAYQTALNEAFFFVEDLSQAADDIAIDSDQEMKSRANYHQAQLNLETGHLFRVVLFISDDKHTSQDKKTKPKNRLLIIAHHLIIDGVSWRILFADLQKICIQLLNHQPIALGKKSSSFRQWQAALSELANVNARENSSTHELSYWQTIAQQFTKTSNTLISDRQSDSVINHDRHRVVAILSKQHTQQLLEQVNSAYNTEVNDILLSAMLLALHETRELKTLGLMLEGHGREAINEQLDISKTIGWFTSMYPVFLSLPDDSNENQSGDTFATTIKSVKEQLRAIPNNGIAYSALRYLHTDEAVRQSLAVKADISFNYLGQTGNLFNDSDYFDFATESEGDSVSPDNQHPHLLDLSAIVIDGQLEVSWVYSTRHFNENSIDELSSHYLHTLEQIIKHCLMPENTGFTPSDFPLIASLEQNKLDELCQSIPQMEDLYPLSPLQEGMLFHSLYQQNEEVYIEQMQMQLLGELNVDAFSNAWNQVIHDHTILRTGFFSQQGLAPMQLVFSEALCPVIVTDAQHWNDNDFAEFFQNDRQKGFDLTQAPLMRLNLLQQQPERYTFVWTSHHILADGWSFPLIIQAVMENYEAFLVTDKKQLNVLKASPIDEYKQFIHYLHKQDKEAEAQYWQKYLLAADDTDSALNDNRDISGATALPYAAQHYDAKNTARNDSLSLELSQNKTTALNNLCQQYHVTINTLIQGLWAILLHKYTGEKHILYGMTVSGRPSEISAVEKKIGLYINSLPVKMSIHSKQTIKDWFYDLQQQQVEHQKFHHSGLSDIQNWTGIPAEQLFNQLFVFENYPVSDAIKDNKLSLEIADVKLIEKTNYPLTITCSVTDRLKVEFGFNTQVYPDSAVIETIAEHFELLMTSLLDLAKVNQQAQVHELNWFSEYEKDCVLKQWNQTQHAYNDQACLHQMIELHAQQTPEQVAVVSSTQSLTYVELNQQANQLAHYLLAKGIKQGDFIGLCFERNSDLVVALLAILKAGAAYIPMDPEYPASRLQHIIDDSQAKVILTHSLQALPIQEKLKDISAQIMALDVLQATLVTMSDSNPNLDCQPEQAAYMIYTSGSTGQPKGVLCHHRGVMNLLSHFHRLQAFTVGEQHSLWTSISFDVSVYEFFSALTTGGSIHLLAEAIRLDAASLFDYFAEQQITSAYLPPFFLAQYDSWLNTHPDKSALKRMLVGVEPIAESLLIAIQNKVPNLQIINGYGPTEATICCTLYPIDSSKPSGLINTPIGKPVDNGQIYLLDENAHPVPIGINGEICIAGQGITHGYWHQKALSDEKFISNPFSSSADKLYRTGDMARYLPDGNIEFIGRRDTQIKLRGYRIELSEIETQLRALAVVKESIVVIHQTDADSEAGKRLVAYVSLTADFIASGNRFDTQAIKTQLGLSLPDYMIPAMIIAMDTFPLSPNGKIDKKALPEPEFEQVEFIAADTPIQKNLCEIWSQILYSDIQDKDLQKPLGMKDNFFAIGGHSLLATQVISHINKHYGIEMPIKTLFDFPSIEQLAEQVSLFETDALDTIKPLTIMPAVDRQNIPLSFAQERLWFIEQFDAKSSDNNDSNISKAYTIPVLLKLTGDLNVKKLEAVFATLIDRHQVLSTRFVTHEGIAHQAITQPSNWQLEYDDLSRSDLANTALQKDLQKRIELEINKGFDLSQGNLFRTVLLKTSAQNYHLLIVMHHIISDAWSMSLLMDEFSILYAGLESKSKLNDKHSDPVQLLARLPIQYTDYSVWQRQWLSGERLEQQLNYWTEQLNNVPVLELPTDYARPSVQAYRGKEYTFIINQSVQEKLNHVAIAHQSTLFMTLMASFSILLNKYTRQKDICIGSPIANRNRQEIESLIGFFVNTLAIRQHIDPEQGFDALLQQLKDTTLDAYEHQALPFEKIVDALGVERNMSHSPVFQVMFILQNKLAKLESMAGLQIEEQKLKNNTAKFDLTFSCVETETGLRTTIEYRSDLFKPETIERLADYFSRILTIVSQNPAVRIADIDMLSEHERQQQLVTWQTPAIEHKYYASLATMFEAQVAKTPDAIALSYGEQRLTYAQLNEQANQLAHLLNARGIGFGQSVGICLSRSMEMMIALYGVIKSGASYIPMDINYPKERLLYMLEATDSPLIITQSELQEKLHIASNKVFLVDKQWSEIKPLCRDNLPEQDLRDAPLYTIFTSGSTGKPKGARVKHSGELNLLAWYIDDFNLCPNDNILLMSAFGFDLTQKNLFAPLMCGATLVIPEIDHYDNEYLVNLIHQEKITWLNCAPSAFYPLIENNQDWQAINTLRYVFLGGEAISLAKIKPWNLQSDCHLVNSYGPTECTDIASYHVLELSADVENHSPEKHSPEKHSPEKHSIEKNIPIGKANHNVQLYILNDELQLIPEGNIGELYIGGEGIGLGYLNQPELTADSFIASPFSSSQDNALIYKTGDLVRYQQDGVIEYIGRVDSQVKLRGLRIELGEIEYHLLQNPAISDVAVRIVKNTLAVEQLVAYVVFNDEVIANNEIRHYLSEHLPDYMLPNVIIDLPTLPLTPNGKVDNKALPDLTDVDNSENYQAPESQLQQQLADIWSDILAVSPIGCHDNFFHLGGNSLIAVRLLARINDAFAVQLSVKSLFEQPVLAAFSSLIEAQQNCQLTRQDILIPQERPDVLPLSYAQNRLWFIEQMNPADAAYNISSALRISGDLEASIVEKVFLQIIARHESLRTNFLNEQGEAIQLIHSVNAPEFKHWTLKLIDLSDVAASEREVLKRAEADARTPFDLSKEPLFRVQLLKLSDTEHVLLFAMHHIISDGWSMEVLQRDFARFYQYYRDNGARLCLPASLSDVVPEIKVQYADYALWQAQKMDQDYIDSQLDFWKSYLQDIPNQLHLPIDFQRPAVATQNGAHYQFSIDNAVFKRLKIQAKEQQVSLFMSLLSAWQILLAKYSQQDDICVGIPVSGRERNEIKDVIGFFVNVIVIRADLSLNPSFIELLAQTKSNTLDAFEHQAIPAEMVIDAVQPVRDTSHAPIAQVGFSYTDATGQNLDNDIPGISIEALNIETHSAKYDVTLSLSETMLGKDGEHGLQGELEYNTDLFKPDTIAKMAEHFTTLLSIISEQAERSIAAIDLLSQEALFSELSISHDEFERIEPLAPTQKDIFLQSTINAEGHQNCMGYLTESNGDFNVDTWYEALELLYQYEPYLRVEFRTANSVLADMAYQCIHKQRKPAYQFIDLSQHDESTAREKAKVWIQKETYQSYTLTNTDLLSHYVFKIAEQQYYVAAAFHHILLDGVGGYMLWKKLTFIYNALLDGRLSAGEYAHAEPLFLQHIHSHNQALDHQDVLLFWQQTAEAIEPLNFTLPAYENNALLKSCKTSSSNPAVKVVQKTLQLDNKEWTEIRQFCRKQRTTPSLYFKAIYGLLLKSYCRAEQNFAIGDYIGGRKKQHIYALGCYFEQSPYVFDTESMKGELKDYLTAIKLHQKVVNKHLPISLTQQNKIFTTSVFRPTYNFYAWPYADEFIGNMQRGITYAPEVAETQLQFIVKAMEDDATLILDYTSNTFAEDFFLQQVKAISDQFIAGETDLTQLQWLNRAEQQLQLENWQSQSIELQYVTVHEMFEQQVQKTPDNIAIRYAGQAMTFAELNSKANQLGHYMQQQGIGRGDQVGICLGRSFEMIIAVLATIKTGAGYVPMDISYPDERLKFTLNEVNAALLITDAKMQHKLDFDSNKLFTIESHWHKLDALSQHNLNAECQTDDPFYTIFTSGSTGRPKGAAVSHRCEINMLDWYSNTTYPMHENENVLVMSAFGFDLTQKNIFAPLTRGATLILPEINDYDPVHLTRLIEQEQVTWTTCTPSAFFPLIETPEQWAQLISLNYVFFGGEPLKAEKMKAWQAQSQCQLVNTFGPTECTDIATYHHLQDLDAYNHRAIPIGKPNANVKIYILDDALKLLPVGMTGEIYIGGASVGLGYITQPELTKEKFVHDPFSNEPDAIMYKTGDLGRYQDNEGNIEHAGRIDFQLKLRGLRIELGEIEYALQQQKGVDEVLVIEHKGQLLAYLTSDDKSNVTSNAASELSTDHAQLKTNLARFLPQYMIPQQFIELKHFPLTEHGKIDRKKLPEPTAQTQTRFCAAGTDTEKALVNIWSKTLDATQVGIHDNFFDLGGHSLIAVKLIAQIEAKFDCKLPIVQLMQTPTIADIAEYIDQTRNRDAKGDSDNSLLVCLQAEGDETPVFCIHGVGGNIHTFAALAKQLGNNRPFYAIQSSGLLEHAEIHHSVSTMVTAYIKEIEQKRATGPLILAGHSMGGVIAFEIASYFKKQGREVEQLILLDSPSPRVIKEELRNQGFDWLDENTREQLQAYMELSFDDDFEALSFDAKLDYMLAQIKQQIESDDNFIHRTIAVHIANFMAINRFDTQSLFAGDILLLKAQSNEGHSRYWEEFTSAQLIAKNVNGDHHTMLDSPNVEQIAEEICEHHT